MNKLNLIPKKIKQKYLSINDSLENYFSKLNFVKSKLRKNNIPIICNHHEVLSTYITDISEKFEYIGAKYCLIGKYTNDL